MAFTAIYPAKRTSGKGNSSKGGRRRSRSGRRGGGRNRSRSRNRSNT